MHVGRKKRQRGTEGKSYKRAQGNLRMMNVYYLSCDSFTGVYIFQMYPSVHFKYRQLYVNTSKIDLCF